MKAIYENPLPTSLSLMKYEMFLKDMEQYMGAPKEWKWNLQNENKHVSDSYTILKNFYNCAAKFQMPWVKNGQRQQLK